MVRDESAALHMYKLSSLLGAEVTMLRENLESTCRQNLKICARISPYVNIKGWHDDSPIWNGIQVNVLAQGPTI